jgi:hypothetical protein
MGKFYENLDDLTQLVKKLEKKDEIAIFILRAISYAKENSKLSVHQIIKDTKNNKI